MLQFQLRIGQLTKCVSSSLPESFDLRTVVGLVGLVGLELVTAKKSQEPRDNSQHSLVTGSWLRKSVRRRVRQSTMDKVRPGSFL